MATGSSYITLPYLLSSRRNSKASAGAYPTACNRATSAYNILYYPIMRQMSHEGNAKMSSKRAGFTVFLFSVCFPTQFLILDAPLDGSSFFIRLGLELYHGPRDD